MSPRDLDTALVGSGPVVALSAVGPSAGGRSELAERARGERLHRRALAVPPRRRTIPAVKHELPARGVRVRPPEPVRAGASTA